MTEFSVCPQVRDLTYAGIIHYSSIYVYRYTYLYYACFAHAALDGNLKWEQGKGGQRETRDRDTARRLEY